MSSSTNKLVLFGGILALAGLVYLWETVTGASDENKAAGESLAAAVEAYKLQQGRYPERLEDLVPKVIAEIPQAGQYFLIVYAVEPGGKQCWVAYQVHRDRFEEYDCRKHAWQNVEFEDSRAVRHPNAQKLRPALWGR